jgi:hypothetical protein
MNSNTLYLSIVHLPMIADILRLVTFPHLVILFETMTDVVDSHESGHDTEPVDDEVLHVLLHLERKKKNSAIRLAVIINY